MSDFLTMTPEQVEGLPQDQAEAVLAAWVKARRTELPEALSGSKSKPLAKLAKKALYQLKSQGLEVKDPSAPARAEAKAQESSEPAGLPGVLSPVVGTGERAILFAAPLRGGGLEIFQGIISDEFGLVQFGTGQTNRNIYRARVRELERDGALKVLKVPLSRMKEELGRAMTLNERSGTKLPDEWETSLRKLGIVPLDPEVPVPALEADDARDAERAASLHEEPELNQWMPGEAELAALAEKAQEVRSSPLALTDAQKAEQLAKKATALAREFLTPERRKLYARRLWFTAELFDATERGAQAALARAEARRLFHGTEPSAFIDRMFLKAAEQAPAQPSAAEVAASHLGSPKPQ
ncbi:MAG: hypothetical protein AB1730_22330 [Myxococcota bacterium]|jgi:hypothetical protein